MVENKEAEKINMGKFFTSDENAKDEDGGYIIRRMSTGTSSGSTARSVQMSAFRQTADRFWKNKLIRNTAICAVAALVIWGIASTGTPAGQQAAGAIRGVIDYQTNLEKDLGDLKFVDSALDENTEMVLANESPAASSSANASEAAAPAEAAAQAAPSAAVSSGASADAAKAAAQAADAVYPLDGIVTTTFAQSKSGVTITATDSTDVKSVKAGKVSSINKNYLVVQNGDSSVTTYYGVTASVKKGDSVQSGQKIGKLVSQTLYVEETVNGEKADPLS